MNFLEKPIEEYKHFNGYLDGNPKFTIRCLVWFPKSFEQEEPHVFILARELAEYKRLEHYLVPQNDKSINLTIPRTTLEDPIPYGFYLFKKLQFSHSRVKIYAENWEEGFFKYRWPSHAISKQKTDPEQYLEEQAFTLFYTPSKLLNSHISTMAHYNGELKRLYSHDIEVKTLSNLGIESIRTDKYTNSDETFVLELTTKKKVNTVLGFNRQIKPIARFIFSVVSFLERKKINWHQANFISNENYYEIFNTRQVLYSAKNDFPLVEPYVFPEAFEVILRNATVDDIQYKSELCLAYISGLEYSVNTNIILWNSLLEKVLKHQNLIKKDAEKAKGIQKLGIPISDLKPIKELINLRNEIAHGDDMDNSKLFKLSQDWELLIERIILSELGFRQFYKTQAHTK
ncbi:hypothetical protein [Thiomicrorhabdus indica]|uniref:hypothetical protein n=1 Tax=Thiomicrorhabdus indica TaxID=2267253 RepID=UPI00102DD831|nr:hypothetical protein [Thiomicrorhabdus indica]